MKLLLLPLFIFAPQVASASPGDQPATLTPSINDATESDEAQAPKRKKKSVHYELSFQGRSMSVPGIILNGWFFNERDAEWAHDDHTRPKALAASFGVEWVIKGKHANGLFYLNYIDVNMEPGVFDSKEDDSDPFDAVYLAPTSDYGFVTFGADYAYEAHLVKTGQTNGVFGLSMLFGAGACLAITTGQIDMWDPGDELNPPTAAYERFARGEDPDGRVAEGYRVLPFPTLNAGFRFNFADRFVVRLEGGLHPLPYYGATAGVMF